MPKNIILILAAVYCLLLFSEIVVRILIKYKPARNFSELKARVHSWWIMAAIFTIALIVHKNVSIVFLAIVSFLALKEYFTLVPTRRADRRVIFWAYLTIPLQYYFAGISWYGMFLIFIPVYMFLAIPIRMIIAGETKSFLKSVGIIHWGLMSTVYCLSHATFLLNLPLNINPVAGGAGLLLFLVLMTQLNDVAQYFFGKLFGKHKVVPTISPGKTMEGLLGGIVATTCLSVLIAPYLTPLTTMRAAFVGLILSLSGFIGDVNMSAIKRDIGVKDSGTLIPGHGGILDRIDSLLYTAPLFFHYIYYFYV